MKTDYFAILREVLARDDLTKHDKLVFVAILSHRNTNKLRCNPSIQRIMTVSSIKGNATVIKAIKNLETKGFIRVDRKARKSSQYWFKDCWNSPDI